LSVNRGVRLITAGAAGGGDIRGVQLAESCKHDVGVCDDDDISGERMMGHLERRSEAIPGNSEFNSQDVDLWLFATMGTKPEERIMGQLERWMESISGKFNSQHITYALWAYATMGANPGERLIGQLERRAEVISGGF